LLLQPVVYPDTTTTLHKLVSKPDQNSTGIDMEVIIISEREQRVAARCFEDIVVYDYQAGQKTALPAFIIEELGSAYDAQEQAKVNVAAEIRELEKLLG
jgi:Thioesterase-like superfamily